MHNTIDKIDRMCCNNSTCRKMNKMQPVSNIQQAAKSDKCQLKQ